MECDFFSDLGQLLVAGDVLMAEQSWDPADPICLKGLSYSHFQGRRWVPRSAFRRYTNKADYPLVVAMISLLLLDESDFKLTEPIISGALFVFPEGTASEKVRVEAWNAHWAGWRTTRLDGTPLSVDDSDPYFEKGWGYCRVQFFAIPLVEVENQAALKGRVIDPLLRMINENKSPSS